jgi:glyoxylase-like metal-dependent hydrolase (beta-lactamase superfamily II)
MSNQGARAEHGLHGGDVLTTVPGDGRSKLKPGKLRLKMHIQQVKLSKMATFCYLIADEASRTCALLDPAFDTDRLLALAAEQDLKITHVINTHNHSDHTAGNAAIIAATGASICIHRLDAAALGKFFNRGFARLMGGKGSPSADVLLEDGDTVSIGATDLTVIHTPGHTPGGICLHAGRHLFTGDTVFVGSAGRTDLPGGNRRQLETSLATRICSLPGDTTLWPGHDYGAAPSSTVAREMETNPFMQF